VWSERRRDFPELTRGVRSANHGREAPVVSASPAALPVLAARPSAGSRSRAVVMVKASKDRYANYDCRIGRCGERWLGGQALSDPLVRPCDVEIVEAVLLQHVLDVPLAKDDDVIETVAPDAAEKSLANRIHERGLDCRPKNPHAGALCGTVEVGAELAVVVADDELGPGAEGCGFPELLRRPLRRWVPSYPTCTTCLVLMSTMKNARTGLNQMS
jgi:hypothetical protein